MTILRSLHDAFHCLSPLKEISTPRTAHIQLQRDTRHDHHVNVEGMRTDKEDCKDHVAPYRADSLADSLAHSQMSDAMDVDPLPLNQNENEDDAIINCICRFGKGVDDDDAIRCDQCGTWQHSLCYFFQTPLPADEELYLCAGCAPREMDGEAARQRMERKIRKLEVFGDQVLELRCEIQQRSDEIWRFQMQHDENSGDLVTNGPGLEAEATADSYSVLDDLVSNRRYLEEVMERTRTERDAITRRVTELEEDLSRVRRNDLTRVEELRAKWAVAAAQPRLWTTACALGGKAAVPHTKPPILLAPPVKIKKGV